MTTLRKPDHVPTEAARPVPWGCAGTWVKCQLIPSTSLRICVQNLFSVIQAPVESPMLVIQAPQTLTGPSPYYPHQDFIRIVCQYEAHFPYGMDPMACRLGPGSLLRRRDRCLVPLRCGLRPFRVGRRQALIWITAYVSVASGILACLWTIP